MGIRIKKLPPPTDVVPEKKPLVVLERMEASEAQERTKQGISRLLVDFRTKHNKNMQEVVDINPADPNVDIAEAGSTIKDAKNKVLQGKELGYGVYGDLSKFEAAKAKRINTLRKLAENAGMDAAEAGEIAKGYKESTAVDKTPLNEHMKELTAHEKTINEKKREAIKATKGKRDRNDAAEGMINIEAEDPELAGFFKAKKTQILLLFKAKQADFDAKLEEFLYGPAGVGDFLVGTSEAGEQFVQLDVNVALKQIEKILRDERKKYSPLKEEAMEGLLGKAIEQADADLLADPTKTTADLMAVLERLNDTKAHVTLFFEEIPDDPDAIPASAEVRYFGKLSDMSDEDKKKISVNFDKKMRLLDAPVIQPHAGLVALSAGMDTKMVISGTFDRDSKLTPMDIRGRTGDEIILSSSGMADKVLSPKVPDQLDEIKKIMEKLPNDRQFSMDTDKKHPKALIENLLNGKDKENRLETICALFETMERGQKINGTQTVLRGPRGGEPYAPKAWLSYLNKNVNVATTIEGDADDFVTVTEHFPGNPASEPRRMSCYSSDFKQIVRALQQNVQGDFPKTQEELDEEAARRAKTIAP